MQAFLRHGLLALAGIVGMAHAADVPLPKRDLTVELRQVEEGHAEGGHYSAGSAEAPRWEPQQVQVRNGERALLRMTDAMPMQWTQSVSTQPSTPSNGTAGSSASPPSGPSRTPGATHTPYANATASVTQALVWFDAGQSMSVLPKWPGGNKPVVVDVEVQRAAVEARSGAELPQQTRNTVSTTVTLPLAEWVTIATTGQAPKRGVYSSESGMQSRRLLQLRVMAP